jgi:hypothetical protein
MALRKIRDREALSNRCTHFTRCAAWDSCPGFVRTEEVAGDEVVPEYPRKSWNSNLMTWQSFSNDSWSKIPSDLKWLRQNMPSLKKK